VPRPGVAEQPPDQHGGGWMGGMMESKGVEVERGVLVARSTHKARRRGIFFRWFVAFAMFGVDVGENNQSFCQATIRGPLRTRYCGHVQGSLPTPAFLQRACSRVNARLWLSAGCFFSGLSEGRTLNFWVVQVIPPNLVPIFRHTLLHFIALR
jgi:hypothetical protein